MKFVHLYHFKGATVIAETEMDGRWIFFFFLNNQSLILLQEKKDEQI